MEATEKVKFHVPMNSLRVRLSEKPWDLSVDVELFLLPAEPNAIDPECIKKTADRHHQIILSEWESFIPHALTFNFNQFEQQRPNWRDDVCSIAIRDQALTVSRLKKNVAGFFNGSTLGSITERDEGTKDRRQSLMIGDVELVGRNLDGEIRGMIGVKPPSDVEIKERRLVTLFNERRLHEPTARAIAQVVGYMIDNRCKYGVLSTCNETRFLCATDSDHIAISEVVLADAETVAGPPCSVTLRRAFGYWLHLCNQPDGLLLFYESVPTPATSWCEPLLQKKRHTVAEQQETTRYVPTAGLQSSNDDVPLQSSACEPSLQGLEVGHTFLEESKCHTTTTTKASPAKYLDVVTSHELFVPWSELHIVDLVGTGRCGCVALARRGGLELALKLFDISKSVEGFEQELRAYTMLQATNAKTVKLLLVTHSPSEQVFGLGLQLGRPLPPLESWSRRQLKGVMAALRSLLDVGIVQNDVREYNFIEDNHNHHGQVLAIDFEDISVITTTNDQDNATSCVGSDSILSEAPPCYLQHIWEEFCRARRRRRHQTSRGVVI